MTRDGEIRIGTSGWHYQHWKGPFYPAGLPDAQMLPFYATRLGSAEINNTFYRLPEKSTVERWRDSVPAGFVFAVKASRYLTHVRKLNEPEGPLATFLERAGALGDKLGPVLFQLPPGWKCNPERLMMFLAALPPEHRYAFEFRDSTWFVEEVRQALSARGNCAFCIYDLAGRQSRRWVTADFVYVRLHGPADAYGGNYDESALADWAKLLQSFARSGKDAYCYFNNDARGFAVQNALRLSMLVAGTAEPVGVRDPHSGGG